MLSLAQQYPRDHVHVVDLPYRLASWAFDYPANIHAWRGPTGELLAWAVLQTPFWTVDIACRPDLEEALFPEILAWVESAACLVTDTPSGRPAWYANVFPRQQRRLAALEAAGWACQSEVGEDSWEEVLLVCDLKSNKGVAKGAPPPGYCLRPLAGAAEAGAYAALPSACTSRPVSRCASPSCSIAKISPARLSLQAQPAPAAASPASPRWPGREHRPAACSYRSSGPSRPGLCSRCGCWPGRAPCS